MHAIPSPRLKAAERLQPLRAKGPITLELQLKASSGSSARGSSRAWRRFTPSERESMVSCCSSSSSSNGPMVINRVSSSRTEAANRRAPILAAAAVGAAAAPAAVGAAGTSSSSRSSSSTSSSGSSSNQQHSISRSSGSSRCSSSSRSSNSNRSTSTSRSSSSSSSQPARSPTLQAKKAMEPKAFLSAWGAVARVRPLGEETAGLAKTQTTAELSLRWQDKNKRTANKEEETGDR
ncbi:hypothetical protein ACSSS7_008158 [Eimeria intestinalis]